MKERGALHPRVVLWCAVLLTTVAVYSTYRADSKWMQTAQGGGKDLTRSGVLVVNAVGMVTWPLIWLHLVGEDDALTPTLLACMLWVWVLIAIDTHALVTGEPPRTGSVDTLYTPLLATQASGLVGLSFSIGALLGGTSTRKRPSRPIVMSSLLICIALIIPQPIAPLGESTQQVVHAVKKVGFNYAVGLLMSGIAIAVKNENS